MKQKTLANQAVRETPLREVLRAGMLAGEGPAPKAVTLRVETPVERLQVWRLNRAAEKGKWRKFQEIGAKSKSAYVGERALQIAAEKKQPGAFGYIASRTRIAEVQKYGLTLAAENGNWPAFKRIAINSEITEAGVFGARLAGERGNAKAVDAIARNASSSTVRKAAAEEAAKLKLWVTVEGADYRAELMGGAVNADVDALVSKRDAKGLTALINAAPEAVARYGLAEAAKADLWGVVKDTLLYGWPNSPKELCFDLARDAKRWDVFWEAMRSGKLNDQADAVDYALKNKLWAVFWDGTGLNAKRIYGKIAEQVVDAALAEGEEVVAVYFARRHSPELEKKVMDWGAENHRFDLVDRAQHTTRSDKVMKYGNTVYARAEKEDVVIAAGKEDWDLLTEFGINGKLDVANLSVDRLAEHGGFWGWEMGVNKIACHTKEPDVADHIMDVAIEGGNIATLFWLFKYNPEVSERAFRRVIDDETFALFKHNSIIRARRKKEEEGG